jgi:hypothetical protein
MASPAATPAPMRPLILGRIALPAGADRTGPRRPWRLVVVCCLALAALSLLAPSSVTYDPWAWLMWGRQIAHLGLDTTGGPSWKPLPVMFTTPFSLFGDSLAPNLWLIVARAGGLLAVVMAFRLAARLAGPAAGVIAAAGLLLADRFVSLSARGSTEGLQVALVLWAVERHLDGYRRDAFLLGLAAGLLRPEMWPFVGLYGLWLIVGERRAGTSWRTTALVLGGFVALGVLWFIPEYIGSGNFLRAASRAKEPVAGSPAESDNPFLATFTNGAAESSVPVYVGAAVAVVLAVVARPRDRRAWTVLGLAALSTGIMVVVAGLAVDGFTGNRRYVLLPAALLCVLAGVGWAQLARGARGRFGKSAAGALVVVALAGSAPFAIAHLDRLHRQLDGVRSEANRNDDAPRAIAAAGGKAALLRCGRLYTDAFSTSMLAWYLHLHQRQVGFRQQPPGTTFESRGQRAARDPRFRRIAETREWVVGSSCARRG